VEGGFHDRLQLSAYQTRTGKLLSLLDFPGTGRLEPMIKVNLKEDPLPPKSTISPTPTPGAIGNSLDRFMGIWSEEEAAEFLKAIEVFEEIDESMWS
jgi:hypothetical protein